MTNYKDFISNILTEMADFRAYHGTPKVFGDFEYHAAGKGNDALGAGFYFTDSTDVANAYTEETEGSNIRVATLTMDKPIVIEDHGDGEVVKSKPLTRLQIQKLVTSSPYFSQEIGNWDDVEFKGLGVVTRNVVNTYFEERDPMSQLIGIMREFYLKDLEAFSVNAKKYTGYDGIEKIFYNVGRNRDETWRHYVVWNKNQIKPMRSVNESLSNDTKFRMNEFGLSPRDLDSDGYITLYHGGVKLPRRLRKDEIFFMTASKEVAEDYARMRKGRVFELKVNPDDVFWNTGSQEVEFDKGGIIVDGRIVPTEIKPKTKPQGNIRTFDGFGIGEVLPKSKFKIVDMVTHDTGNTQFLLKTPNGERWYDAKTIVAYERGN